ncbi:uncharacterized protein LOC123293396 isoform X1 [Chrysoperla carnea]|uniref:uncharacterized protein LOC123293396 isoform X1 n=1 Tax=Chrysoperla carnea TaxID=189513 RepID=UPI001D07186E|nr:uncharacterized protein LOC123293396 isoform X1 [Chrysoperla carnea]
MKLKVLLLKFLWIFIIICGQVCCENSTFKDFMVMDVLSDGEKELRIHYKGITAKEMSVGYKNGLTLRQLTDGRHFIQLIYDGENDLKDCEYIKNSHIVNNFLQQFQLDVDTLKQTKNISIISLDNNKNTVLISHNNSLTIYKNIVPEWLNYSKLKRQCHRIQLEIQQAVINHNTSTLHRSRRNVIDMLRSVFIAPGTRWCGYENDARKYTHLGINDSTDKCCRRHDHCKINISAMSKRWNLWNSRPYTISHCSCDLSFRACLKLTDSGASNMVGKLFFNVVQTKCFVIKSKRVCKKRSFWGNQCLKHGYKKQAILRDNVPY